MRKIESFQDYHRCPLTSNEVRPARCTEGLGACEPCEYFEGTCKQTSSGYTVYCNFPCSSAHSHSEVKSLSRQTENFIQSIHSIAREQLAADTSDFLRWYTVYDMTAHILGLVEVSDEDMEWADKKAKKLGLT